MTETNKTVLASVTDYSQRHQEPEWMLTNRQSAAKQIEALELPTIDKTRFNRWDLMNGVIENTPAEAKADIPELATEGLGIVIYGNESLALNLPAKYADQGVIFTDFATAIKEHSDLVEKYFMTQAVKADENKLTAYHAANVNGGVFLYVPKNVVIEEPVEVRLIQNAHSNQDFNKHILILADTHSKVSYVEVLETLGSEKSSASIITEVITKDGAKVAYSALDRLGESTTSSIIRKAHVGRDSDVDWAIGMMNGADVVYNLDTSLVGDGSVSNLKAVAVSTGRQKQVANTRITNYGRHSVANIYQHGVILDRATLTFNGIGHIKKGAVGSDAQQESRILMLTEKGRGDANPILLIDDNEVTAGHAASVGRVDPEQLFYLQSRGLNDHVARKLVVRGFLGSVITAIPVKEIAQMLITDIDRKLEDDAK